MGQKHRIHLAEPRHALCLAAGTSSHHTVKWTDHLLGSPIKLSRESNFYNHGWALLDVKENTATASYWQYAVGSPI